MCKSASGDDRFHLRAGLYDAGAVQREPSISAGQTLELLDFATEAVSEIGTLVLCALDPIIDHVSVVNRPKRRTWSQES